MASPHPTRTDLTAEYVRSILDYDPETGAFRWKRRADAAPWWNGRYAGSDAGAVAPSGYHMITVNRRRYYAHRIAWLHVHGCWPSAEIDHANGDPQDNRLSNLRPSTARQNKGNAKRRSDNTTGFKGVERKRGRFAARIRYEGRRYNLGTFDTPEEAHAAYLEAARQHFGEFAKEG